MSEQKEQRQAVGVALNVGWRRYFFPVVIGITVMVIAFWVLAYLSSQRISRVEGFITPTDVAVGPDGLIYVADAGAASDLGDGVVYRIEDGQPVVFASGLQDPRGLAFFDNTLMVSDRDKVWRITAGGQATVWLTAADFPDPPEHLEDIAVADESTFFVLDSRLNAVFLVQPGATSGVMIDSTNVFLSVPGDIVFDPQNNDLWVGDFMDGRLIRVGMDRTSSSIQTQIGSVSGLSLMSNGRLYLSEASTGKVWTRPPNGDARVLLQGLSLPSGLALDADEKRLVIAETGAGRITIVDLQ